VIRVLNLVVVKAGYPIAKATHVGGICEWVGGGVFGDQL